MSYCNANNWRPWKSKKRTLSVRIHNNRIGSVADPGCLSWSWILSLSDPGSHNIIKTGGESNFLATNLTKFKRFRTGRYGCRKTIWNRYRKQKFERVDKELLYFLPKKLSLSSQNMSWGSGIRKEPILGPGSRGQKSTGSGSASCNTVDRHKTNYM